MRMIEWSALFVVVGLFLLAGCSREPTRYPVEGAITVDGKPLNSGDVNFNPEDPVRSPHAGSGSISNGKYSLDVPLGKYKVTVAPDPGSEGAPRPFHQKYEHVGQTPLIVEVVESPAADAYDLKLTKKK